VGTAFTTVAAGVEGIVGVAVASSPEEQPIEAKINEDITKPATIRLRDVCTPMLFNASLHFSQ
jgi:hypothetical protein